MPEGRVGRLGALGALALLAACSGEPQAPTHLRVSAVPDQSAKNVRAQHLPILEIVCPAAGVRCEWVDLPTYEGVVEALGRGEIHLAYLGGATYAQARQRHGAWPIAIRDVDTRFSSTLLVRAASPYTRLHDLRGASFLFGNRSSTSGHIMARYFLVRAGVEPEKFFRRVEYSGNHDATLEGVAGGRAEAGIVNSSIALRALAAGGRYEQHLRVLWESPAYVDYVWTAGHEVPEALRKRLADAFLDVNRERADHAVALRAQGAGGFLPASEQDYGLLAAALHAAAGVP